MRVMPTVITDRPAFSQFFAIDRTETVAAPGWTNEYLPWT